MSKSEIENLKQQLITYQKEKDEAIDSLERNIDNQIKEINKKLKNPNDTKSDQNLDKDLDLVRPFEKDIDASDTRPSLFKGKDINIQNLSNHELHKVKDYLEKDHRQTQKTIMDESLGEILDSTINFLAKSSDGLDTKYHEASLLLNVYSTDKTALTRLKVYITALALFIRDDKNAIYIGLILIFLSIIIYFINIITFK